MSIQGSGLPSMAEFYQIAKQEIEDAIGSLKQISCLADEYKPFLKDQELEDLEYIVEKVEGAETEIRKAVPTLRERELDDLEKSARSCRTEFERHEDRYPW